MSGRIEPAQDMDSLLLERQAGTVSVPAPIAQAKRQFNGIALR